jgi:hypothetical protein
MSKKTGYSWSLDISTTNVGMALWYESGDLVELNHLELKVDRSIAQEERYLHKANLFKEYVFKYREHIKEKYGAVIENIFVEAPLSNTPVNINTTAKLLSFNGIACYILDEIFGKPPYLISVYQSRKLFCPELVKITKKRNGQIKETLSFGKDVDKKQYIWKKVADLEPQIDWFYTRTGKLKGSSYDMSDAYCVGVAGLKVMGVIE